MFFITIGGRRWWKKIGIIAVILLVVVAAFWMIRSGTIPVSRAKKLLPIYSVGITEKKVALSFDACWGAELTPEILLVLKENNVKSTFFLVNIWLEDYPEEARLIAENGHEIGMHSTTHPHFTTLSTEEMKQELEKNHNMIKQITGYDARLFRPPFGDYNDDVIRTVNQFGYIPIQWDVDSLDWRDGYTAQKIYQRVTERVKPGSIVLFHNNGEHTAEALPQIITYLKQEGYSLVPISDLLIKGDYYIDVNGTQQSASGIE